MILGIDSASPKITAKSAKLIKEAGYAFCGRYLVPNTGSLAWKALTRDEAQIITAAGLHILTVYETTASRAREGTSAGFVDGKRALQCAKDIGMPTCGVIYFAVDYDAKDTDMGLIESYLKAARSETGPYEIGVYGSYRVIEEMYKRRACKGFWQCVAWSYGKKSEHRHVYQAKAGLSVAGIGVDLNECESLDAAGIWTYVKEEDKMTVDKIVEEMTPAQAYKLLAKAQEYAAEAPFSVSDAVRAEYQQAIDSGITDGTNPMQLATRWQVALMATRAQGGQEDDGK